MVSISRREFLRVSSLASAATVIAACVQPVSTEQPAVATQPPATALAPVAAPTQPPAVPTQPPATAQPAAPRNREAPMLADRVAKGELPPVEERLPENPLVVTDGEGVGKYGGNIRRAFKGVSDNPMLGYFNHRKFLEFNPDYSLRADVGESWESNADATVWTVHLRKGMKWSDGSPLTSADVQYFFVDFLENKDLNPSIHNDYKTGSGDDKKVVVLTTPDDYTLVFTFALPKPLWPFIMENRDMYQPAEYMKQFHMAWTPDKAALEKAVKDAGVDSWVQYYTEKNSYYLNPERPVIWNWVATNKLSDELFVMERNPYFFHVDTDGNQLPYHDNYSFRLFETTDVFLMWIINGEIDWQGRHVSAENFTLLKENQEKGGYHLPVGVTAEHIGLNPNHATKNALVREFFGSRDVRIGLSLALNRDEINQLVWDGLLKPRQYSPLEESPQYYPKLSEAYIAYDPDQANQLLDQAGYSARDGEGFRMWKDGSGRVTFTIEGWFPAGTGEADSVEVAIQQLAQVGVQAVYKSVERSLYTEHYQANEVECGCWGGDRTLLPITTPDIFLGLMADRPWAGAWGLWKSNPNDPNGEQPPEGHWIWKIWEIWDQVALEPDDAKRNALFFQILDIWAEELPMITFLGERPTLTVVKNGLLNVVEKGPSESYSASAYWDAPEEHVLAGS